MRSFRLHSIQEGFEHCHGKFGISFESESLKRGYALSALVALLMMSGHSGSRQTEALLCLMLRTNCAIHKLTLPYFLTLLGNQYQYKFNHIHQSDNYNSPTNVQVRDPEI